MKTFSKKPLLYALAAFSIGVSFSSFAEIRNVTLLHTNDIESVYEPVDAFWNPDISRIGGIPYLATLIKQTRAQEETSFLFDAGDIFTGSLAKKTQGKLSFDLYSAMGYDAITLGNHEFEYGWQTLKENMPRAAYPVLNANIKFEQNNAPFASPYTIVERDGIRVGVIGVMGVDAFYNTMWKGNRKGLTIDDPIKTTQFWVDKIRDEVDMVVVLTHQNKTAPMQTDKEADPEVQRGFDEDYDMAGKLKGVDVIFGGHSDHGLWKPVESDKLERDKKTSDLIANARKQYPDLGQQLATINDTAYRRYYRESNVGNLVADMIREAAKADVGMISSGSIRVDLNKGPVTMENVMDLFPFTDKLSVVKLNGVQLKELLEYSYTLPYGLAQFSGIEAHYDNAKPQGKRLLSLNVNGKPVNDSQSYKVATYSYAASGGDGYHVFEKGTLESQGDSVTQVLIDQFKAKKDVIVPALGRQVDVSVKE
ncbi:Ser/Thr protein phosphatase family protein [Vibrio parahaemolyticus AQ3810]|uniref:bifunctional metallophosphatase/5'-nucleotidase n=1 Tax=Vibrio parahaemolyticus TaxID=670 RepID=UPI0001564A86|nr:bifunctional UDP-sugar hydrolase/5'-nucleotidase [Vibrio parahaemolyticus]EDM60431.1 Ser/Thr protein phosphatase family protein [Vibrio parahaemolyticus AQ3810]EJG1924780.1 bifunctional metallophosphatase/5'-nucleotidase [Vibrio parahaemolyticus]EXF72692.1 calcineurin-like phosphoesterase family protein [Vibrio parahaemolyticus AQ3810]